MYLLTWYFQRWKRWKRPEGAEEPRRYLSGFWDPMLMPGLQLLLEMWRAACDEVLAEITSDKKGVLDSISETVEPPEPPPVVTILKADVLFAMPEYEVAMLVAQSEDPHPHCL